MQLAVGRVLRPHGIRGEVAVEVRTDDPGERFAPGRVLATDPPQAGPLTVESARWHSGRLLVTFTGIADRDRAELLRGTWLTVDSAALPRPADPDEYPDADLIGLRVLTTAGQPVGTVTDVLHHGQDLLVIDAAAVEAGEAGTGGAEVGVGSPGTGSPGAGGGQVLVPFVGAIVVEVDVAGGRLVIDPPPGLLELRAGPPGGG